MFIVAKLRILSSVFSLLRKVDDTEVEKIKWGVLNIFLLVSVTMSTAPLMVTVSGVRGIAHKSLTPELVETFIGSFVKFQVLFRLLLDYSSKNCCKRFTSYSSELFHHANC